VRIYKKYCIACLYFCMITRRKIGVMKKIILFIAFSFCLNAKAQWMPQDAGFTNRTLGFFEISIVNENIVWAICYDGVGGLFGPAHILDFTRTTDGGANWMPGVMGSDTSLAFSNICALSDTEAWVAMHKFDLSHGGGLFHTTDGGLTWNQSPGAFDTSSFPNFVHFKDPLNGIAGGDATGGYFEIYTTTDGGSTWTRTPQANIPAFTTGGGYGWFDGFAVLGDTVWFGTSKGEMYKSTDYGLTWTISTVSPLGYTVYEIAFNDDGMNGLTHVRNGSATYLFATTDGGSTWTQRTPHAKWKRSKLTAVPGTDAFVSTSVLSGSTLRGSSYSTDLGITWVEIDNTAPKAACRFLNGTTGWAGGFFNDIPGVAPISGGIYKWADTVSVGINNNIAPIDRDGLIYPNPASDKLNFELKGISDFQLMIYDALGMLIKKANHLNERSIDISELENGVYFYVFKNGGATITGKFIKY
jgi:photosystem II stability/assembly factor-like uncharacterized protein